jgi:hypothetical protein
MAQILVGYKLVDMGDNVYETWGGTFGSTPSVPSHIVLPSGDHVHAPALNTFYQGRKLVEWYRDAPVVIPDISDRQFFQEAYILGMITEDEALLAVQVGAIPSTLLSIINSISDPNSQFAAKMILSGATTFQRNHPLVEQVRIALNKTSEEIDQFFIDASKL